MSKSQPSLSETNEPSPIFDQPLLTSQPSSPQKTNSPILSPAPQYGFTKLIDLPGIGIRAFFTEDTTITYTDPNTAYMACVSTSDCVSFEIVDYDGGSRRNWYAKNYALIPGQLFKEYTTPNHSGYLIYNPSNTDSFDFTYITVVNNKQILKIEPEYYAPSIYFGSDINRFKAFLSSLTLIDRNIEGIARADQAKSPTWDTLRWSETKKTIWQNDQLGIKVISPEWVEHRWPSSFNSDHTVAEYTDWTRTYTEMSRYLSYTEQYVTYGVSTGIPTFGGPGRDIIVLPESYSSTKFDQIVSTLLIPFSFCSEEWHESKSDCEPASSYCYTKQDLINNLFIKKTQKFGPYTGQLRSINATFNNNFDCRANDQWLIQVKNDQYILTNIFPDDQLAQIEYY